MVLGKAPPPQSPSWGPSGWAEAGFHLVVWLPRCQGEPSLPCWRETGGERHVAFQGWGALPPPLPPSSHQSPAADLVTGLLYSFGLRIVRTLYIIANKIKFKKKPLKIQRQIT